MEKKIVISTSIAIAVVCIIVILLIVCTRGKQQSAEAVVMLKNLDKYTSKPWVHYVPKPIDVSKAFSSPQSTISSREYKFQIPWNDPNRKEENEEGVLKVSFNFGLKLSVINHPEDPVEMWTNEIAGSETKNKLNEILDIEKENSKYAFYKAFLEVIPENLSGSDRLSKDDMRTSHLLIIKSLFLGFANSGVYSFDTEKIQGFQFNRRSSTSTIVHLDCFSDDNRHIQVILATSDGINITQDDINCMIRSFEFLKRGS